MAPRLLTIYGIGPFPGLADGLPKATRHGSGVLPIGARQAAVALAMVGTEASAGDEGEGQVHGSEHAHLAKRQQGAGPGLNMRAVGVSRLRSPKRAQARREAARDLDDAMKITGQSSADIAAALDYDRKDVVSIRGAEKPLEVGHLRLLPESTAAVLLARVVARLGLVARALFAAEELRVRGAT